MIVTNKTQIINLIIDLGQMLRTHDDGLGFSPPIRPTDLIMSAHDYMRAFVATYDRYRIDLKLGKTNDKFTAWLKTNGPMKSSPEIGVVFNIYIQTGVNLLGGDKDRTLKTISLIDGLRAEFKGIFPIELIRCYLTGITSGTVSAAQKQVSGDETVIRRIRCDRNFEWHPTLLLSGDADWAATYQALLEAKSPGTWFGLFVNRADMKPYNVKNVGQSGHLAQLPTLKIPVSQYLVNGK